MKFRTLGKNGPRVSAIGLGCMGMSGYHGTHDDAVSIRTLHHALDKGLNFLDTAEIYGPYTNEQLVGRAIAGRRNQVFLATKFGIAPGSNNEAARSVNGHPDNVRASCEGSLKRLGVDHIDLYYQHRIDPNVPIEETVGAMALLVKAGKVRHLGLSAVSVATLERAHAVHPITALQSEYSLWARDPEDGMFATCQRLRIGFVAYNSLGGGFLNGAVKSANGFNAGDFRRLTPHVQGDNFARNLTFVAKAKQLAADKGCTLAQLTLAWVLSRNEHIVPIPGSRRIVNLDDNLGALTVQLSAAEIAAIDAVFSPIIAAGVRYEAEIMKMVEV